MTPKQEAAMRQALEALEYVIARDFKFASIAEPIGNSIAAMRKALTEKADELAMWPEGYEIHELPADYTGRVWIEGQVRRLYVAANPKLKEKNT